MPQEVLLASISLASRRIVTWESDANGTSAVRPHFGEGAAQRPAIQRLESGALISAQTADTMSEIFTVDRALKSFYLGSRHKMLYGTACYQFARTYGVKFASEPMGTFY